MAEKVMILENADLMIPLLDLVFACVQFREVYSDRIAYSPVVTDRARREMFLALAAAERALAVPAGEIPAGPPDAPFLVTEMPE